MLPKPVPTQIPLPKTLSSSLDNSLNKPLLFIGSTHGSELDFFTNAIFIYYYNYLIRN